MWHGSDNTGSTDDTGELQWHSVLRHSNENGQVHFPGKIHRITGVCHRRNAASFFSCTDSTKH